MKFVETPLPGAYVVTLEPLRDERGWFARTFDAAAFADLGLDPAVVQCSVSFNARAGTLRGMHFQAEPHGEPKLVRCTRGAVFDVIVDVRPDSPAFRQWFGLELRAGGTESLFIPSGLAHGFQTLEDASECTTRWATTTSARRRAACAGTTPRSVSHGLSRRPADE